jgi:cytochrome P450
MQEATEVVTELKRRAPGPRAWPLLGNVGALRGLIPFLEQQWSTHGDVFRVRILGMRALLAAHPEQIQRILIGNRQNYIKDSVYENLRRLVGQGLVTLEGDAWKERRTLANPAFHRASLAKLAAIMVDSGARFFDAIEAAIAHEPKVIDVHQAMVRLTLDVVINALFGRGLLQSSEVSYSAIEDSLELVSAGANGVTLPPWVPTPRNLRFHRTIRALDDNMYTIINAARAQQTDGTLLSMLLSARDEEGNPLSDQQLRNELVTLFIAGHETTALTLTWMFVLLEQAPEVLARMREVVDGVLGGREPTFADVPKLGYLRQVVDETLRLRPPAAMVGRNAVGADELGGYSVERGDVVLPFFWGVHRHPDFWREPQRFDPERFAPSESKGRHNCAYVPFSVGPRICIGNTFSLVETQLLIAQMLNRFEFEISPCTDVKPAAVGTVRPSKPVRVRFKRRK